MTKKKEENKQVVFRRMGGRIVPIVVGAGLVNVGRTKSVYKKGSITIDQRGKKLIMRKNGKKVGYSKFGITKNKYNQIGDSKIKMVSVDKKFRGKGYGRTLIKETARAARQRGAKSMFSAIVGKRAATIKNKSDKFYEFNPRMNEIGQSFFRETKRIKNRNLEKDYLFRKTNISRLKYKTKNTINLWPRKNKLMLAAGIGSLAYGVFKDGRK